jgi:hypothetical protein
MSVLNRIDYTGYFAQCTAEEKFQVHAEWFPSLGPECQTP